MSGEPIPANAAIYYIPEGYSTAGATLMGINSASEGFLRGYARHAKIDAAYCAIETEDAATAFHEIIQQERPGLMVKAFGLRVTDLLQETGCLYLPGPGLPEFAWRRRQTGQRGYSLCGVTHTTATASVLDSIAQFAVAPIQDWDALICTSRAVRRMIETLLCDHRDYLGERLGLKTIPTPQLPTIPLGINCSAFAHDPRARAEWRAKLAIGEDDIAVLFFGRLSFHAKANPIAMYRALQMAAARTGRKFHLIQAGWFPHPTIEVHYRETGAQLCPDVHLTFLDGREASVRSTIWSAADVFTSLADNIQETFGLTPIEAMSAGLPVVVSDWDGYRDTVRHGVDGFRIPTLAPEASLGGDLAYQFAFREIDYDVFIGRASHFISIGIEACASAYAALAADPGLRKQMGASGAAHARARFDWSVIIPDYQALWADLAARRQSAAESVARKDEVPLWPARPDPFRVFGDYPSRTLNGTDRIVRSGDDAAMLELLYGSPLSAWRETVLPSLDECRRVLSDLDTDDRTVDAIVARHEIGRQGFVRRGILWLVKMGLVRVL